MNALAAGLLRQVRAGAPVSRREAVRLARAVLECDAVRAAEAVLEADDGLLIARVTELAEALLTFAGDTDEAVTRESSRPEHVETSRN